MVESLDVNDSSGTKGRVALLKNMVAAGYQVTALHYTQKDIQLDGITTIAVPEKKSKYYFLSRLQRYCYKWFGVNIGDWYEKRSGFSFSWKGATHAFAKALKHYNPQDYDMIWTLGKGTQFRPHAALLKLPEWHNKWYAYVHDPYPQHLYPRPYNFVEHGYKKKRYFFIAVTEKAQKVVFPSQLLQEWMQSYYVAVADKSVIIPHQLTVEVVDDTIILPNYFDASKFNIVHAGNLLDLRDPKPLVEAYTTFLEKHPEAQQNSALLFIGKTSRFDTYLKTASTTTKSIYSSDGYVDFKLVNAMQHKASVNVILEAKSEISPFLPGKFTHCVAAHNPILLIGPYYSESKRLLGKEYPYSFDFDDVQHLADALAILYTKWKAKETLSLNRPDLLEYVSTAYLQKTLSI